MGSQVTAQKQMWYARICLTQGLRLLRVRGGEGGEMIHETYKNELVLLGFFPFNCSVCPSPRRGRWGAARSSPLPPPHAVVGAGRARGGTVHFLFPCRRRGGPDREGGGGGAWRRRGEAGRGRPRWRRTCWRTSWRYGRAANKGGPGMAGGRGAGTPGPAVEAAALGGAPADGAGTGAAPPAGGVPDAQPRR